MKYVPFIKQSHFCDNKITPCALPEQRLLSDEVDDSDYHKVLNYPFIIYLARGRGQNLCSTVFISQSPATLSPTHLWLQELFPGSDAFQQNEKVT
jgi:hypothetical protein